MKGAVGARVTVGSVGRAHAARGALLEGLFTIAMAEGGVVTSAPVSI